MKLPPHKTVLHMQRLAAVGSMLVLTLYSVKLANSPAAARLWPVERSQRRHYASPRWLESALAIRRLSRVGLSLVALLVMLTRHAMALESAYHDGAIHEASDWAGF